MTPEESKQPSSTAGFVGEVEQFIDDSRLLDGVCRIIVGCSGGADSTVLLDVLLMLVPRFDLELAVCHLNHGLRAAAGDDEDHVRNLAERAGVPFFAERVDLAPETGSVEAIARRARLDFYVRTMDRWPADAVALGHSADDQAETVLMNLARGTGLRGLGGIRPRAMVGGILILRPLLFARRNAIRTYAREGGLVWREDESNADLAITRNRVRRRLLPEIESIHPKAVDHIVRTAALARDEEEWFSSEVDAVYEVVRREDRFPGAVSLDLAGLREVALGLRRRLVRRALEQVRGHGRGLSSAHVEAVLDQVSGSLGGAVDLPGVRVRQDGEALRLLPLAGRKLGQGGNGRNEDN